MIYTELTKKALKIAFEAHKNQVDKSGLPYIHHPIHLAEQMETEDETCVALLHDVVEDTYVTIEDLIKSGFNDNVIYALKLLTHDNCEPYFDYVKRIKACSHLAAKVKLSDLKHNSDLTRLDVVLEKDIKRVEKYKKAISILTSENYRLYGAVIGDVVGSKYEFDNIKTKDFPFLSDGCDYTDDTIMTIAVANALLRVKNSDFSELESYFVEEMQKLGRKYPNPMGAYGGNFVCWLTDENPKPYQSCGNGSAMRVSACGLYASDLFEALELAEMSANVTHNHPEGIKGAKAVAAAIFLAKEGKPKETIKKYITDNFYELNKTADEIREYYDFDPTCQGTVPEALTAFFESENFEDSIRIAVSLGGDTDTLAAITGSVSWVYYSSGSVVNDKFEIPVKMEIVEKINSLLPEEFLETMKEFEKRCIDRALLNNNTLR